MRPALLAVNLLALAGSALGHMSQQNFSMRAEVVAEVFITAKEIRVELEFPASASSTGERALSLAPLLTANRELLATPKLRQIALRPRTVRDSVTGDPVSKATKSEDAHFAVLVYRIDTKPELVSLAPPLDAPGDYGFLVSHDGLAVNHFNYLRQEELLTLDWNDPFYSRFRNPRLKRAFSEPLEIFLTIEGSRVRVDVLARPRDALPSLPNGPIADRETVLQDMATWQRESFALKAKDDLFPVAEKPHFIRRSLLGTTPIEPTESLDSTTALVAISSEFEQHGSPIGSLQCEWRDFNSRYQRIPLTIREGTQLTRHVLAPDLPRITWTAALVIPVVGPLPAAPKIPTWTFPDPLALLLALLVISIALKFVEIQTMRRRVLITLIALVGSALIFELVGQRKVIRDPTAQGEQLEPERANLICHRLLSDDLDVAVRVHEGNWKGRRFSSRQDRQDWKHTFETVSADLTRTDAFGVPHRLRRLILHKIEYTEPPTTFGFTATCDAELFLGTTHWGHVHNERLRRTIMITVEPQDGHWQATAMKYTVIATE